jgi:hypothetical protein
VRQRYSVTSGQPYLSVLAPRARTAADGGGDPAVGIVERPRRGDQVEHGVFDAVAGRWHRRESSVEGLLPRHDAVLILKLAAPAQAAFAFHGN